VTVEPRDLAVQALYEADQRDLTNRNDDLPPKAARLVAGVLEHVRELDDEIDSASEHWRVQRMPVVDRAILRLGLYELRYETDTPAAVVVAEAVRLAKTFSTERSGAFVNGVLATLAEKERGSETPWGRGAN
jgi:N utilization substance protein B